MLAVMTIIFTAGAAAAPSLAPVLASLPAWAHAAMAGSVAAFGAIYHLLQPSPLEPAKPSA